MFYKVNSIVSYDISSERGCDDVIFYWVLVCQGGGGYNTTYLTVTVWVTVTTYKCVYKSDNENHHAQKYYPTKHKQCYDQKFTWGVIKHKLQMFQDVGISLLTSTSNFKFTAGGFT